MTQKHHIQYDPDWIVELTGWQHKVITHIQRMKPTGKNYAALTNFAHAVMHEWNRIRCQLDTAEDKNLNKKIERNPKLGS